MSKHNLTLLAHVVGTLAVVLTLSTLHSPALSPISNPTTNRASMRTKVVDSQTRGQKAITFKGVSFIYDSALAENVKADVLAESMDGKPGDVVPAHIVFTLVGYPKALKSRRDGRPLIMVFPIAKYRRIMTAYTKEMAASTWPHTDWVPYLDDQIRTLKALIKRKPLPVTLPEVLSRGRMDYHKGQMPFLPLYEAHQAFHARIKYLPFKNGKGVLFLTQVDTETRQITNEDLEYVFQGITDDGHHYVSAEFGLRAPVIPEGFEPEVIAWSEKNYLLSHSSKEYQTYLQPVVANLEALPANKFEPNLTLIEHLIKSLRIETEVSNTTKSNGNK